ncbi:MAG TPA: HlyD family efflux transporter periplasmic adaptor subunit [Thermoanaerobaculia bacterium]|nr:HlyD family efflux transporter periplasmic adaptor subunit [Thermoanaerobaculia bacterium]
MDREIALEDRQKRVAKQVATAILAIAVVAFLFAATIQWLRPSLDRRKIQIARVERGAIAATLEANGTVVPLIERVVSSPVEARVLRVGRRAGDRVKAGDELLTLDTSASQLEAARLNDQVSQKESADTELRLRLEETIASLRAQIEQKKLDAQIVHYSAKQKATLRAEGLIAEEDALAANALAQKTDIELRQLDEALRRATRSRDAQLSASRAEVTMAQREREESRRQLELAMLRADRDGVLTSIVQEVGATIRRGDVLARIADLSAYRVEASISDVHAAKLAAGMRAKVTLEGAAIDGIIESVDPRIVNGVVKFFVTLDQPAHPRLRNNLRVDVAVITGTRGNTLVVRRGALGRTNATHAFVVRDDAAVRVPVRYGLAGTEQIEILEGLSAGDEVVISDISQYDDVAELRLKK